jgi:hypothetical protein
MPDAELHPAPARQRVLTDGKIVAAITIDLHHQNSRYD